MDFTTLLVTRCRLNFQQADIAAGLSRMPRCGLRASTTRLALIRLIISLCRRNLSSTLHQPHPCLPTSLRKKERSFYLASSKRFLALLHELRQTGPRSQTHLQPLCLRQHAPPIAHHHLSVLPQRSGSPLHACLKTSREFLKHESKTIMLRSQLTIPNRRRRM